MAKKRNIQRNRLGEISHQLATAILEATGHLKSWGIQFNDRKSRTKRNTSKKPLGNDGNDNETSEKKSESAIAIVDNAKEPEIRPETLVASQVASQMAVVILGILNVESAIESEGEK